MELFSLNVRHEQHPWNGCKYCIFSLPRRYTHHVHFAGANLAATNWQGYAGYTGNVHRTSVLFHTFWWIWSSIHDICLCTSVWARGLHPLALPHQTFTYLPTMQNTTLRRRTFGVTNWQEYAGYVNIGHHASVLFQTITWNSFEYCTFSSNPMNLIKNLRVYP